MSDTEKAGIIDIYAIPKLASIDRRRILRNVQRLVEHGLIEWIDREKGLARITPLGIVVQEAKQPSN